MTSSEQKPTWCKPFPVIGKGTFLFSIKRSKPFRIIVRPDSHDKSSIKLEVGKEAASFTCTLNDQVLTHDSATKPHVFFKNNIGIENDVLCTYWFSYDSDRMVVKYGKGYRMSKTTILTQNLFNETRRIDIKKAFFDPKVRRNVKLYDESKMDTEPAVDFDHQPFVSDRPPVVVDSSMFNMYDLDKGRFTYSASLPKECLELYTNATARNVDLAFTNAGTCPGFNLVDAIRNSILQPGALLNDLIKHKEKKVGEKNAKETYLRIPLGYEYGNPPGVLYVLEIWPSDHGSPLHNHGNAYAVIRVLHGGITINVYNKTSQEGQDQSVVEKGFLFKFDVKKGDITWLSPNWYQTHKLWNGTGDFCITLNCYQNGQNDKTHWPHFDYVPSCNDMNVFEPNSDITFSEMVSKLKKEFLK